MGEGVRVIDHQMLLAAMRQGKCLDGAALLFPPCDGLVPFSPPVLQAGFELGSATNNTQPPELRSEPLRVIDFEAMADVTWATVDATAGTNTLPKLPHTELLQALAIASQEIAELQQGRDVAERLRMRGGLQISGVHIIGDSKTDTLALANVQLPFSLRLICCVIDVPLSLNNCELVTLDLSGSVLAGLDATFLKASGSVRLRRTVVQTPVDFGGARIHGYFDGSDLVIKPFGPTPRHQGFDGDRGMLNLSQATIDNDIRLERATIWGGLAMRGLQTQRSVFLDEAVILSPVGMLEKLASYAVEGKVPSSAGNPWKSLRELDDLPTKSKPEVYTSGRQILAKRAADLGTRAFIERGRVGWKVSCFIPLLIESLRVRTSSVRADGMVIGGSFFAQSITSHGRLRLKYAQISGGLSLFGSRLRGIEASRRMFDDLIEHAPGGIRLDGLAQLEAFRRFTYRRTVSVLESLRDRLAYGADGYSVDIREAKIGGSVQVGEAPGLHQNPTTIDGPFSASGATIDGDIHFANVRFAWKVRASKRPRDILRSFRNRKSKFRYWDREHRKEVENGKSFLVDLATATITDSVSFDSSRGLQGLNLRGTVIKGDLSFFAEESRPDSGDLPALKSNHLKITGAATGLSGRINMTSVEIAGDCRLLFDRSEGPHILAENARIGSVLHISTATARKGNGELVRPAAETAFIDLSPGIFDEQDDHNTEVFNAYQRAARKAWENPEAWDDWCTGQEKLPHVNLQNAAATVFSHIPAAWPDVGRLIVTGFRYKSTTGNGPLAPHPFKIYHRGRPPLRTWLWAVARVAIGTQIIVGGNVGSASLLPETFQQWHLLAETDLVNYFGLLLIVAGGYLMYRITLEPLESQSRPMAIAYFNLQRLDRNRFRSKTSLWSYRRSSLNAIKLYFARPLPPGSGRRPFNLLGGHVYNGIDAYATAANSLREDGRLVSANLVEKRRLDVRAGYLSWRLHFFSKLMYKLLDWLTGNGFSFVPLGYVTVLLVLMTAMVANHGVRVGAIVRNEGGAPLQVKYPDKNPDGAMVILSTPLKACIATDTADPKPRSGSAKLVPEDVNVDGCASFSPIAYAIDTVIPTTDTGEKARWEFNDAQTKQPTFAGIAIMSYKKWLVVAHLAGLALFGLFLTGISTRFGSVVSRYID